MFGYHIENEIDYSRSFPLIVFLIQKEKLHQSGNTENFRIKVVGLGGRERDSRFLRKKKGGERHGRRAEKVKSKECRWLDVAYYKCIVSLLFPPCKTYIWNRNDLQVFLELLLNVFHINLFFLTRRNLFNPDIHKMGSVVFLLVHNF